MLTSTICCFVLLQLTQGKYVFLNYSPVIPRSGNSSLVCADLGCRASRSQLSISRMRPWRGGLSARHSSVLGNCGRKVTWYTYLDKAEGAFTCGRNKEKITTFKMNYKGSLRPLNFTRRVNVGERLLLEMEVTNSSKPQFAGVLWYKNRIKFTATSRAWTVRNGLSLVIHNVTMGDAGVYTARYYDETIEAGIVVSVRDCPRNLWSRDCSKRCPVCNNNGECDVTTGLCVCQPGFGGKHCQSACPANYFGPNCTTSCSDVTDDVTCRGVEMCQSIGCNCMSGWTGPDCKEKCPPDRYGAGCTERCLCSNQGTCDRFRGCICPPRWFGTSCKSRIDHKQQTNRYSSHVPLQLKREVSPRIVEIVAVPSSFKVNAGQSAQVRCAVSGLPLPIPGEITVRGNGSRVIKAKKTIVSLNRTTAIFSLGVVSLYPGPYSCVATTISGTASKTFSFNVSALPRPIRAPRLIHQGASRLVIGLNSFPFTGDGPIVRKVVQFKRANETTYNHYDKTIPYNDSIAISALDEYTSYDVRVVLYREGGITGRGKPGPVATFTTKCQVPTAPPVITLIHRIRNSTSVYLVWEIPDARTIRGELKDFTIVIYPIENQLKPVVYDEVDRRRRTAVLKNLSPLQVYGVKMQMANCAGSSPYSKEARVTMGKLDKPQGPKLFLTNLTSTSASYKWETPLNAEPYTIITYEVTFNETFNFSPNAMRLTTNTSLMTYEFDELAPFTSYSLRVRAFNHETAGNYSDVITAVTHEAAPSAPTNLRSSSATSTSVRLMWDPPLMRNGVMRGFQLQMKQEGEQWEDVDVAGNNTSRDVENLKEYSQYRFRVRGFTVASGKWSDVISVTTMSNKPLKPPVIVDVDVITSQSVTIRWTPPDPSPFVGNITSYKVIYTDDLRQTNEHWRTKVVSGDQTSLVIQELRADSVYSFKVAAATRQLSEYSNKITRRTDRLGLPPSPYDVICSNVTSSSAMITWSVRKGFRITFVKIRFLNSGDEDPLLVEIDDEEKQHKLLTSLKPLSGYEIEVIASNYVGESSGNPTLSFRTKLGASSTLDKDNAVVPFVSSMTFKIILGVISLIVIVVIAMTVVACRRYASKPQVMYPSQVEMDLRGNTLGSSQGGGFHSRTGTMMSSYSVPSSDSRCPSTYSGQIFPEALILPWENILFEDIPLGVGNFGQVVKAVVQKDNKIIQTAVKMLKDGSTTDDKRDFLAELDTMVRIGHHKNVLSLVGACEHDNAMYLCTEFAPNGNLLQFLRKSRRPEEDDGSYTTLSQNQLLQFASDVAQGMAYLSEKSLIHRDLAARNILLGDHLVCKVADFGLSRGEGVYVKKTVSRLPIRWMAIESLNYNVYTSKSDVWSFGVLLWEIVSLGGTPYCGMSCAELYEKLPTGYRMEKPINCDDEVYALMVQCWKDRPYDRPTFAQLCVALERMCDARSSRNYVNTAIFEDFKFATIDVNEEEG